MTRQLTTYVRSLEQRVEALERTVGDAFADIDEDTIQAPLDDVTTEAEAHNKAEAENAGDGNLERLSRPELDERARDAGVESPEELPNKRAVADAIRQARQ